MHRERIRTTASKPARLLARAALLAALIAVFTSSFFGNALPSIAPGGAEFSSAAKRFSVASHYRGKSGDYRAAASGWTGKAPH